MGHPWRTENRERLSPLTILHIIRRVRAGEHAACVGREYGVNGSTIGRWIKRWATEAQALPEDAYACLKDKPARSEGLQAVG